MQNLIAQGALIIWPLVALVLFMTLPAGRAVIWTILGGYLLLPVAISFDLPALPALDKSTLPNLTALLLAPLFVKRGTFRWPVSPMVKLLMLIWVLVPFGTMWNNGAPLIVGTSVRPGIGVWETVSAMVSNGLDLVPFFLGAALLSDAKGHRDIVRAIIIGALVYSLPILAEIRLSPFLQDKIYGVVRSGYFLQQMRGGGFRAMVFLGHGLLVSTFLAMALVGVLGLSKGRSTRFFGLPAPLIAAGLAVILLLNKSLGAVLLVLAVAPLLLLLRQRRYLGLVFLAGAVLVSYPMVRGTGLLPLQALIETVGQYNPQRAESFAFRVRNEDLLLNRADQKPFFGWGRFGRNRVFVESKYTGYSDVAITDGMWVIIVGVFGWIGYIASFGLLCYPFLRAFRMRRTLLPAATVALLTMHLVNMLDLIPNSSLRPITWLIAGALANMTLASLRERAVVRENGKAGDAAGLRPPLLPQGA